MVTEHDKAIVAAIIALIQLGASFGIIPIDASQMATITAIITPIVVWLVPNK